MKKSDRRGNGKYKGPEAGQAWWIEETGKKASMTIAE